MRELELALKAAADPTRTRILKLLEGESLCGCQLQAVLGIAPSTVSKHLATLRLAGLVEDRRSGRWVEYRLAATPRNTAAAAVLEVVRGSVTKDPKVRADRARLRAVQSIPMDQLCALPAAEVRGVVPEHRAPSTRRPRHG